MATPERLVYPLLSHEFITPRGAVAQMQYRQGTNDWNTIFASMSADEYRLRDLRLSGLAVDIGAYVGSVGIALALDNPELNVLCVEPVPENVALIRMNVRLNGLQEQVVVLPTGAAGPAIETTKVRWRFRGSELADHHAFVGNTSFVEGAGATGVQFEETEVSCWSLSELVEQYGAISFLKIDCEGCEWSFLDDPAMTTIPICVGEWHPVGDRTRADLVALLSNHDITFEGPEAGPGGFKAMLRCV